MDEKLRSAVPAHGGFVLGTLVHTRDGPRRIEELAVGDLVLSAPEDGSGAVADKPVLRILVSEQRTIRQLMVDLAYLKVEVIYASDDQRFWAEKVEWTRADAITRQNVLRAADASAVPVMRPYPVYRTEVPGVGWTQSEAHVELSHGSRYDFENAKGLPMEGFEDVLPKEILDSDNPFLTVTVYTLEVADYHTFFVGRRGTWVHDDTSDHIIQREEDRVRRTRRFAENLTELRVGDVDSTFRVDPLNARLVAPITLPEWESFHSTNSVEGREGERVLLEWAEVYDGTEKARLADRSAYLRSLEFFLSHRAAIQQHVLDACLSFVLQLHATSVSYGVERVELAHVASVDDLQSMIDLSHVKLFPYQAEGLPYIGLHFETNWAEEGLLALLLGTEVIACGYPGSGRAVDESIREDGGVI